MLEDAKEQKRKYAREYGRKYRIANRERIREINRKSRKKDPERTKLWQKKSDLKRTFGLTIEQYDSILISQGDGCAICDRKQKDSKKRLAVDHCHKTMKIRGILCETCNLLIGYSKDNIAILNKAIDYLIKHNHVN